MPGYEWSGNTGMGGDRNVFFAREGRPIRRSSSVLLARDRSGTDVHTARELFEALEGEDAVVIAHVGGRYADLAAAHDGKLERAVEVHSCWGTFEWLLHDAFRLGHRVGLVCHSDDHKGRPGARPSGRLDLRRDRRPHLLSDAASSTARACSRRSADATATARPVPACTSTSRRALWAGRSASPTIRSLARPSARWSSGS